MHVANLTYPLGWLIFKKYCSRWRCRLGVQPNKHMSVLSLLKQYFHAGDFDDDYSAILGLTVNFRRFSLPRIGERIWEIPFSCSFLSENVCGCLLGSAWRAPRTVRWRSLRPVVFHWKTGCEAAASFLMNFSCFEYVPSGTAPVNRVPEVF